jgi:nitrite reductase (NADH) large subunit
MNLSCGVLRQAARGGCATVDELAAATGASTLCGSCKPLLAELVGAPAPAVTSRGTRGLAAAALIALVLCAGLLLSPHVPYSETVQGFPYDTLWRNGAWKQASGFTLVGLSLAGLAMSLRKRLKFFHWGNYEAWRVAHGVTGVSGLLILAAHTGLRFGTDLNFLLMSFFTAANLAGAVAGSAVGFDRQLSGVFGQTLRRGFVWLHMLLVWPLPVLVAFHIFSVYYF